MTIYSTSQGIRKPLRKKLTTNTATTIYTGGSAKAYIETLHFTNITGTAATIDVFINDGTSDFYILLEYSIAAKGTSASRLHLTDIPFDINNGDTLKVTAGTANAIDMLGTLILQGGQSQGG
jgi:hypothetical protein